MLLSIFLGIFHFTFSAEVIELLPDKPLRNLSIAIMEDSALFFRVKNPESKRCYEFYPSWPAGFPADFFGLFVEKPEIQAKFGVNHDDDRFLWCEGNPSNILMLRAKPNAGEYGADGTNSTVPFCMTARSQIMGTTIPVLLIKTVVGAILMAILAFAFAYFIACTPKGTQFLKGIVGQTPPKQD